MLMNLEEVTYHPLSMTESFKAKLSDNVCFVQNKSDESLEVNVIAEDEHLRLRNTKGSAKDFSVHFMICLEYLLGHYPNLKTVTIENPFKANYPFDLLGESFERSEFFQLPLLWHHKSSYSIAPEKWTITNQRSHPIRPKPHQGEVYRRYIPQIKSTVSFRLIDRERDLDIFHHWHNQSRVSFFWELNKPKEELSDYIEKGLNDPHQIPMMVEINGEPLGYYEMYWVREDRLGPYYESEAFDRGFHFLIGNKKYLGHKTTDSVIKSGLHFLFLDDPRTRRIMAEPRHDNQKVLKYAEESVGWKKVKFLIFLIREHGFLRIPENYFSKVTLYEF